MIHDRSMQRSRLGSVYPTGVSATFHPIDWLHQDNDMGKCTGVPSIGCRLRTTMFHSIGLVRRSPGCTRLLLVAAACWAVSSASADEGGVPFWLSGQYASMAAVPPTPGWTVMAMTYYYNGSADMSQTFQKGGNLVKGVDSHMSLVLGQLSYAWDTPLLGGVPMLGMSWGAGNNSTSASLLASLPSVVAQTSLSDSANGGTDLYPIATLSWNKGDNNWMVYLTGDIPVGAYDPKRLSNIGIGHGAVDSGAAYTYLNQKSGLEFSAVAGLTYNLRNSQTDYRNGIDAHLDWAVSQFLSANWQVGLAGYVYYQLTDDSYPNTGAQGAIREKELGGFRSRVASVGPEVGYLFKIGKQTGYLNLRGYWEFWAQNRLEGYAFFATLDLPLGQ